MMFKFLAGFSRFVFFGVLLVITFVVATFHAGTAVPPKETRASSGESFGEWTMKEKFGVNVLVLKGSAFDRGKKTGELTKDLLFKQETKLVEQAKRFVPSRLALKAIIVFASRYFRGLDKFFEPWAQQEIYGVSLSAPIEFEDLADGYTRQIGYHGLHEAGQMMVDQKDGMMGCTVVAVPRPNSSGEKFWIIGRNFDFEGGRIFDDEKIVKWEFPDSSEGNAYVSVIWAGMVGAVTGVNQNGLYISINAAGSDDHRRVGTPSTIVLTKVLQFSQSVEEALAILESETMFITDIFVLYDAKTGRSFVVEKSPRQTAITELKEPSIVTNHLTSRLFTDDKANVARKRELTSLARHARGTELLAELRPENAKTSRDAVEKILSILRDKKGVGGKSLHLGNRAAIDALIATHSVIYDGLESTLYVSRGPSLSGSFTGFDLKKSFAERRPVIASMLNPDPIVSPALFARVHAAENHVRLAHRAFLRGDCGTSGAEVERARELYSESSDYHSARADWYDCLGQKEEARQEWRKALRAAPPYFSDREKLKARIADGEKRVANE